MSTDKPPMCEQVYADAQEALDEILGPNEEDGAGEGLVAEIWLLAAQRDEARAEIERLRPVVEAAEEWYANGGFPERYGAELSAAVETYEAVQLVGADPGEEGRR